MTSKKQLQANRQNAKKSTGPNSTEGKEVASLNATKHGIFSRQVLISTGRSIDESHEALIDLKESLWEELQPVGTLEEMLVDRIVSTLWRMKRFLMAESGMVERQVESHSFRAFLDQYIAFMAARQKPESSFFVRMQTSLGCREIAQLMDHIAREIQKGYPWPEWVSGALEKQLGAREGFPRTEALCILDYGLRHREENAIPENEVAQAIQEATNDAVALAEWFKGVADCLEWKEKDIERADLKAKMIPPLHEVEKLQRYEAHLQRIFTQTLHELQRVQAARLGGPAPMSAALDVTLSSDSEY